MGFFRESQREGSGCLRATVPLLIGLGWAVGAGAQTSGSFPVMPVLEPESRLWVEGDSTLHAWKAEASQVGIEGLVEVLEASDARLRGTLHQLRVVVPARGLQSDKEGLTKNMWEDLKSEECPQIVFRVERCDCPDEISAGSSGTIALVGTLTVACQERPVTVPATVRWIDRRIRVTGQKELQMSDFGIRPRRFLGFMRVKDRVVVRFDLTLRVPGPTQNPSP